MEINILKALTLEELRAYYKIFLQSKDFAGTTVSTSCSDSFYLWNKGGKDLFWNVVSSNDFESEAKEALLKAISENSTGNAKNLASSYMSHLRRFRKFLSSDGAADSKQSAKQADVKRATTKRKTKNVPSPSIEEVDKYLAKWEEMENYRLQEDALNKLFFELCPQNSDLTDILLKASTLNNFYSTNIFKIYPVAKHIYALDIDARLESGDVTLVRDIQYVTIGDTLKNFYSFATKYCSHHNPFEYPIYDSYVDKVLRYFRNRDGFSDFQDGDLKDYVKFKDILIKFKAFYHLDQYTLKQIDQYVWQVGKNYFAKNYGKKK